MPGFSSLPANYKKCNLPLHCSGWAGDRESVLHTALMYSHWMWVSVPLALTPKNFCWMSRSAHKFLLTLVFTTISWCPFSSDRCQVRDYCYILWSCKCERLMIWTSHIKLLSLDSVSVQCHVWMEIFQWAEIKKEKFVDMRSIVVLRFHPMFNLHNNISHLNFSVIVYWPKYRTLIFYLPLPWAPGHAGDW